MTFQSQEPGAHPADAHRPALEFTSDKGANRPKFVALLLLAFLIIWMFVIPMISSVLGEGASEEVVAVREPEPFTVAVRQSQAEQVALSFFAEGQAVAERDSEIIAEVSGRIAAVEADKGDDLQADAIIARLDSDVLEAQLRRAEEELALAQRELTNAEALLSRGIATQDRVTAARSALAAAEAELSSERDALRDSALRAPFSGRLEALDLREGEFVGAGSSIGRMVDLDPLTIHFQVPQQSREDIRVGLPALITFITGEKREGSIRFVATSADSATRTFEAEAIIENPDQNLPAGISAELLVPIGEQEAHFLSPGILSLDSEGRLGIKAVNEENRVEFYTVEIIRADQGGIWVSGLPEQLSLITVGQGFVNAGEEVRPISEEALELAEQTSEGAEG